MQPTTLYVYIYSLTIANRSLPASAVAAMTAAGAGAGTGPDFYARGGLEIKVCVRTYRLFYVSRTEDVLWRVPSSSESGRASARLAARDAARTRWLEEKFSSGRPGPAAGVVAAATAAASSSEAAVVEQQ